MTHRVNSLRGVAVLLCAAVLASIPLLATALAASHDQILEMFTPQQSVQR